MVDAQKEVKKRRPNMTVEELEEEACIVEKKQDIIKRLYKRLFGSEMPEHEDLPKTSASTASVSGELEKTKAAQTQKESTPLSVTKPICG